MFLTIKKVTPCIPACISTWQVFVKIYMLKMKNGHQNKREISQESTSHKIYIFFSLRMRNPFLNLYKKLEVWNIIDKNWAMLQCSNDIKCYRMSIRICCTEYFNLNITHFKGWLHFWSNIKLWINAPDNGDVACLCMNFYIYTTFCVMRKNETHILIFFYRKGMRKTMSSLTQLQTELDKDKSLSNIQR